MKVLKDIGMGIVAGLAFIGACEILKNLLVSKEAKRRGRALDKVMAGDDSLEVLKDFMKFKEDLELASKINGPIAKA